MTETSEFYERYWSGGPQDEALRGERENLIQAVLSPRGGTGADVGCGRGMLLGALISISDEVLALDVSATALKHVASEYPEVRTVQLPSSGSFPISDEQVDKVVCSEVVEHLIDVEQFTGEIARILRPGGRFVLTTPYHGPLKNAVLFTRFDRHFSPLGAHIRFFSKATLRDLLENCGLEIEGWRMFGRHAGLWMMMACWGHRR